MSKKLEFSLILFLLLSITFFSNCSKNKTPIGPQFNSLEEKIDYIVSQYFEVGAAVGVINKQQEQIVLLYGTKTMNEDDPPNENTVFQIGSITKIFTCHHFW